MKQQVSINKVQIYPFSTTDELLDFIADKKQLLIAINAEKIMHATDSMRELINSNIGYADGFGAVLGMRRKGYKDVIKIPGCELWLKIISKYQKTKSFYFVGGRDTVIEATIKKLKCEYPLLNIIGYHNGYFDDNDKKMITQDILNKKPDVVMVALGSPKQELFMHELLLLYPALYMGLGGSFDVYTGNVKRAPDWWVKHNLEFAYRLLKQPSRIKRQIFLLKYIACIALKIY